MLVRAIHDPTFPCGDSLGETQGPASFLIPEVIFMLNQSMIKDYGVESLSKIVSAISS